MSKILTSRMKPFLDELMATDQTAFMRKRRLAEKWSPVKSELRPIGLSTQDRFIATLSAIGLEPGLDLGHIQSRKIFTSTCKRLGTYLPKNLSHWVVILIFLMNHASIYWLFDV